MILCYKRNKTDCENEKPGLSIQNKLSTKTKTQNKNLVLFFFTKHKEQKKKEKEKNCNSRKKNKQSKKKTLNCNDFSHNFFLSCFQQKEKIICVWMKIFCFGKKKVRETQNKKKCCHFQKTFHNPGGRGKSDFHFFLLGIGKLTPRPAPPHSPLLPKKSNIVNNPKKIYKKTK